MTCDVRMAATVTFVTFACKDRHAYKWAINAGQVSRSFGKNERGMQILDGFLRTYLRVDTTSACLKEGEKLSWCWLSFFLLSFSYNKTIGKTKEKNKNEYCGVRWVGHERTKEEEELITTSTRKKKTTDTNRLDTSPRGCCACAPVASVVFTHGVSCAR